MPVLAVKTLLFFLLLVAVFVGTRAGDQQSQHGPAPKRLGISGCITRHSDGAKLSGALVALRQSTLGCFSNASGQYGFELESLGEADSLLFLVCSLNGYHTTGLVLHGPLRRSLQLDIELVKGSGNTTLDYRVDSLGKLKLLRIY